MVLRVISLLSTVAAVASAAWIPTGPDGGNVLALAVSSGHPAVLVAVMNSNTGDLPVFRTTNSGTAWERVGSLPYVSALAADPFDPMAVYCTDGGSQVLRSSDGGASWQSVFLPFTVTAIGCDQFVPGRIYAAGVFYGTTPMPGFGVSTDNGATWSSAAVVQAAGYAYSLDASPVDSGTIFIGAEYGTVFRSTDGGATWESRSAGLNPGDGIRSISASHGDAGVVCAAGTYGMYRTTDGGAGWTPVTGPQYVTCVDYSPAVPATGYCYGYDTAYACYVTTDGGATWQPAARIASSARYNCVIAAPEQGDGAWCPTAGGVMRSTDRGGQWNPANGGLRCAAVTALSVPGWNRERVYAALENVGIFKSSDGGRNWEKCSDFLACGNICGIGLSRGTSADRLYAFEGAG